MKSTNDTHTTLRKIVAVIGLVCLSIATALGIGGWSTLSAFAGKPIGRISKEEATHEGPAIDGDIWFVVNTLEQPSIFDFWNVKSSRIKRLNLETGTESETGLSLQGETGWPMLIDNNFYLMTDQSIYQSVGNSLIHKGPMISWDQTFISFPLMMEGQFTTVRRRDDGGHCLTHLIDGTWIEGRSIVLPGPRRVWEDHPQRQCKTLLPLTSEQPTLKATRGRSILNTATFDHQLYLEFTDIQLFSAYRIGFEFVDGADEVASALAPMNAPREVSGWRPIYPAEAGATWLGIASDNSGLLFNEWGNSQRIVRMHPDGRWEPLKEQYKRKRLESSWFVTNPQNATTYVVYWNHLLGSAKICRVKGNQVQLPHADVSGPRNEYLGRWRRMFTGLLLADFSHIFVLALGFSWITRRERPKSYEFGHQRVVLASFGRRALATALDLVLFLVATAVLCRIGIVSELATQNWSDEMSTQTLMEFELFLQNRFYNLSHGAWSVAFRTTSPDEQLIQACRDFLQHGSLLFAALLVLGLLKFFVEARYGITPGKWLLGIRTVQTTLRSCGLARAIVRTVLVCVDVPFALTPIPALVGMLFSDRWQRLGDRVADTIVIRSQP